jgi:hypothetical protein
MRDRSDIRDDQYEAEVTDSDEVDVLDFPPERSLGVEELLANDVTAAGEYAPDTLRGRKARLHPDVVTSDDLRITGVAPGGLADPDDPYGFDERDQQVGERSAADWQVVDPGMVLADSSAAGHRGVDEWPAEEAALHLEDGEDPASAALPSYADGRAGFIENERGPLP